MIDTLVDEYEAGRILGGISIRTVQSWRQQQRGPRYYKIGRRVLYKLTDLEAFIQAGLRQPGRGARE